VTLAAGVHRGPMVIDREETLRGEPGAVVRGGIVVRADGVTVRDLTVVGGEHGIVVESARRVRLENVRVVGARMDGIHVRFSQIAIRDCTVAVTGPFAQGIDISYSGFVGMSSIEGCDVSGGAEGIATHSSMVMVAGNQVHGTTLRGIAMTEMSMGEISKNTVSGALGVGILCNDHSECEIDRNVVAGTRVDRSADDPARAGVAVEVQFHSLAELEENVLVGNPVRTAAFSNGRFGAPPD